MAFTREVFSTTTSPSFAFALDFHSPYIGDRQWVASGLPVKKYTASSGLSEPSCIPRVGNKQAGTMHLALVFNAEAEGWEKKLCNEFWNAPSPSRSSTPKSIGGTESLGIDKLDKPNA
jgi:hypothetical protein